MRFGERWTPLPLPQRFFPSAFNAHSWTFFVRFVYRYELLFGILTQSTQRIEIYIYVDIINDTLDVM